VIIRTAHASVRVHRHPCNVDEVARRVETGLVPILRGIPGFRGYHAIRCGETVGVSVGLFDGAAAARTSNEDGAAWGKEHLLAGLRDGQPPETPAGAVPVAVGG
jgi:hypothetical protein